MATDDEKLTVIKMIVVNAFEPDKLYARGKIKTKFDADLSVYRGRDITTDDVWNSIKSLRQKLDGGKTDKQRNLHQCALSIAPSSVASAMYAAGINYDTNLRRESRTGANIPAIIGFSIIPIAIMIVLFRAFFGDPVDNRSNDEKRLDAYCASIGRSGCSDTAREIKRISEE